MIGDDDLGPRYQDMPEPKTDDETALSLVRDLLELGVLPRAVTVGAVRLELGQFLPKRPEARPAEPGGYLDRALAGRKAK